MKKKKNAGTDKNTQDLIKGQLPEFGIRDAIEVYMEQGPRACIEMLKYTLEMTDDKAEEIVAAFDEMSDQDMADLLEEAYKMQNEEKTVSEVKDDPGWDKKIEAGHAVGDDTFYKAWDAAVTQEKETDDIDPYSLAFRMMGNCVYMLAHAGFTKKQIVYNIDAPFNAAQEEYKERKKKEKSNGKSSSCDCDKKKSEG
jgi:hypothetical protein